MSHKDQSSTYSAMSSSCTVVNSSSASVCTTTFQDCLFSSTTFARSPMWLPFTTTTSPPFLGTTVCRSFSRRVLMNTFWPPYSTSKHSNSFSLSTSVITAFLRQCLDFLSMILTRMLGTTHFKRFFLRSPSSSPLYNCLRYSLLIAFTSSSPTRTIELLLASSTSSSCSLTSTTTPTSPSCGGLVITTAAPTSNFGFFSSFSCSAPSPSPLGLGLRTRGSLRAFFLLWPMPRQGVKPIDCSKERPKFWTGLLAQAYKSGASAYWAKKASCFISFKIQLTAGNEVTAKRDRLRAEKVERAQSGSILRRIQQQLMRSILNYFFASSRSSSFESLLGEVTEPSLSAPHRESIKEVMEALSGNNPSVRSEFAFATLIAQLHKSQHALLWTFQIKNITLLDRLIEDSLFSKEISQLPLGLFERLPGESFLGLRTQKLVSSLWQLVRYEAQLVESNLHVLCFKRSQRRQFLASLAFPQLLEQLDILESLFRVCLEVSKELRGRDVESFKEEVYAVELVQYLALNLAHKFVSYYACGLLCLQVAAGQLMRQDEQTLRRLGRYCSKFQVNSFELVRFLKAFRKANGFEEFNYEEFNPFHAANLPLMISTVLREQQERTELPLRPRRLSLRNSSIKVELRPFPEVSIRKRPLTPRLKCPPVEAKEKRTIFNDWVSSFSDSFPQQEMMTIDLIMAMKREESGSAAVEYDLSNDSTFFDEFSSFMESSHSIDLSIQEAKTPLAYHPRDSTALLFFNNVYSTLPETWNQP